MKQSDIKEPLLSADKVRAVIDEVRGHVYKGGVVINSHSGAAYSPDDMVRGAHQGRARVVVNPSRWLGYRLASEYTAHANEPLPFALVYLMASLQELPSNAYPLRAHSKQALLDSFAHGDEVLTQLMMSIFDIQPKEELLVANGSVTVEKSRPKLGSVDLTRKAVLTSAVVAINELQRVMPKLLTDRLVCIQLAEAGFRTNSRVIERIKSGDFELMPPERINQFIAAAGIWLNSKQEDLDLVRDSAKPPSTLDIGQVANQIEQYLAAFPKKRGAASRNA